MTQKYFGYLLFILISLITFSLFITACSNNYNLAAPTSSLVNTATNTKTLTTIVTLTNSPTNTATLAVTATFTKTPTNTMTVTPNLTNTQTGTPTFTYTPAPTSYCGTGSTFGTTLAGLYPAGPFAGQGIFFETANLTQAATLTGLVFQSSANPNNGNVWVAIYSGSTLIEQSAPMVTTSGWNTFPMPHVYLAPGTYTLAFQVQGVTNAPSGESNVVTTGVTVGYTGYYAYGAFPATMPAIAYSSTSLYIGFYGIYCPVVSPTATFTPGGNTATYTPTITPTNTPINSPTPGGSCSNGGVVSTLAGSGAVGFVNGTGTAASFYSPNGVAVDSYGNVYVADKNDNVIREISSGGVVTTLAGSGVGGATNGTGTAAEFYLPMGVAVDTSGNVYVADYGDGLIRKITSGSVVTTLAGSAFSPGSNNGTGTAASFYLPTGVAVDSSGNVYVADTANNLIREITPGGVVTTLAGSVGGGFANGTGTAALFSAPTGVAVDFSGNVYVVDAGNYLIRKITSGGVVSTLAGSVGVSGSTNGTGTAASFRSPAGIAVDTTGNIYVGDAGAEMIREITPGGVVTTLAGSGVSGSTNATGTAASFSDPQGVAVDYSCNVYVADTNNQLIRKIH